MSWQNDPATEKQVASITRMNAELGWSEPIPATKGEAGNIIGKMKAEEKKRDTTIPSAPDIAQVPLTFVNPLDF